MKFKYFMNIIFTIIYMNFIKIVNSQKSVPENKGECIKCFFYCNNCINIYSSQYNPSNYIENNKADKKKMNNFNEEIQNINNKNKIEKSEIDHIDNNNINKTTTVKKAIDNNNNKLKRNKKQNNINKSNNLEYLELNNEEKNQIFINNKYISLYKFINKKQIKVKYVFQSISENYIFYCC